MRVIPPGNVVADVGANVGTHKLTLASLVGGSGCVFAFEPNPVVRRRLGRDVFLYDLRQVRIDGHALGANHELEVIRIPAAGTAEAVNPGMASLVALDTPHEVVEVMVAPIDQLLASIKIEPLDLVKFDVQGYEVCVLRGMSSTVIQCRPAIVFEYEDWAGKAAGSSLEDAVELIRSWDYGVRRISVAAGGRLAPADLGPAAERHMELLPLPHDDPRIRTIAALGDKGGDE